MSLLRWIKMLPPPCTLIATSVLALLAINHLHAQTGLNISGPTPWIDVTTYGAKGDLKLNYTGYMTTLNGTNLQLNDSSITGFLPTDIGKFVSVNGAGLPNSAALGTGSQIGSGALQCGQTAYWKFTLIYENSTTGRFVSESIPNSTEQTTALTVTSCGSGGNFAQLQITAPTSTGSATGWIPYVSYLSGGELAQPIAGHCTTSTTGSGCALGATWTSGSANFSFDTAPPPLSPVLLSTIVGYSTAKSVTLADGALTVVPATNKTASVAWGTDNSAAISAAISACIEGNFRATAGGCTVYFPGPTGPTVVGSGRYYIASGISVGNVTPTINLTLLGGGSYGTGEVSGLDSSGPQSMAAQVPNASAEIAGSGRFPLMTFGVTGSQNMADGLNIMNLGFRDSSGTCPPGNGTCPAGSSTAALGNTWGAVRLINVVRPYLERVNVTNFGGGYGIELEGDVNGGTAGMQTQIGAIVNSNCSLCRIGIWGPQSLSDIQIEGGTYSGSAPIGSGITSYGADFETPIYGALPGVSTTGSIRVIGTAFRNHTGDGVRFYDCIGCQAIGVKGEQVKTPSNLGNEIHFDGTGTTNQAGIFHCTGDVAVGGASSGYNFDVNATSGCTKALIVQSALSKVSNASTLAIEVSATNGLLLAGSAVTTPSLAGQLAYNASSNQFVGGLSAGTPVTFPTFAGSNPPSGDCVKWFTGGQIQDAPCATISNNAVLMFFCNNAFPATGTSTEDLTPGGVNTSCGNTTAPTIPVPGVPMPINGTLSHLQVIAGTAPASMFSVVVTVWVNGSASSLACTLSSGSTSCNNSNTVSVTAGQLVYVEAVASGLGSATANLRVAVQYQ